MTFKSKFCLFCIALSFLFSFIPCKILNASQLEFIDKTIESGLNYSLSPSFGLSWGDFNKDGFIDIYIKNHQNYPSLYLNAGNGCFQNITKKAGFYFVDDFHGASWGDFDNDGDMDLYQEIGAARGNAIKSNYLWKNKNTHPVEISDSAGVDDPKGRGRTPAWLDYNNDGLLDLFVGNAYRADAFSVLFRNEGEDFFSDATESAGLTGIANAEGVYVSDINSDHLFDLIILSLGKILIYANNGDATFSQITSKSGLSNINNIHDLALGDYDNDGDIDIFACRGISSSTDAYEIKNDTIYYQVVSKNNIVKGLDFNNLDSKSMQFSIYKDNILFNPNNIFIGQKKYHPESNPFDMDSYDINNFGEPIIENTGTYIWYDSSDALWHIRFYSDDITEVFASGGLIKPSGRFDQVKPYNLDIDYNVYTNKLYQNQGNGRFIDATEDAGLGAEYGKAFSAAFSDFDNDGDLDIYVVYSGMLFNDKNRLYENDGQNHFHNIAGIAGAQGLVRGRGESVAVADYNNDGFQDIMVLNGLGGAPFSFGRRVLLENQKTDNNWLEIRLLGTRSNSDGIGATVHAQVGSLCLTRQQTGGMHRASQNSQILHFGLGGETAINNLVVHWPSGIVQELSNIAANQILKIEEPDIGLALSPRETLLQPGEILEIELEIKNNTSQPQRFYIATNVNMPTGLLHPRPPQFLYGPLWIELPARQTKKTQIAHKLPQNAPLGEYKYNAMIAANASSNWNENHFTFTIGSAPESPQRNAEPSTDFKYTAQ